METMAQKRSIQAVVQPQRKDSSLQRGYRRMFQASAVEANDRQ